MRSKTKTLTNFSRARYSQSFCLRPDNEEQLADYLAHNPQENILVRGSGLCYNDSCFNTDGFIIDSERLNHFINFNPETGIVTCQGGVPLKDLFLVHPDFIPPVLPGTVHATVAGGIAHDVHGKNNHLEGSFGHHLIEFDLLIGSKKIHCSRSENNELFHATIAGLGLTGIITRAALRLKKAPRFVQTKHKQFESLQSLTEYMVTEGIHHDYQVAWLDLLNPVPRALFSVADYCDPFDDKKLKIHSIPKIPFSLIRPWGIKLFNQIFFNHKKGQEKLTLEQFNNPLDKLMHWNRLYGPKGLVQFQAVFSTDHASTTLERLVQLIRLHKATPTLAVLKLFTQSGEGLLSFCQPGFTLAVDFIHNVQAKQAMYAMNQLITELNGRVYLAKDFLLNEEQYHQMYEKHEQFSQTLKRHACIMNSDLANRLGIKK
ncbi:L-gululonolactone oxidase [Legionella qingyii]|uniref:FAD-binding oxidoreductase n=1 Tax=Legionella qingyii TaxID=2184757 RepID=A0A317U978_9GAMM|nr:FAD-binding oxidoreductase [Legionella qingyii]PWY56377.1 L-gululonolactone oxidase [Legionella qingyii]PWY57267.1 L-gululonolactone oxidase [Legionella qingyii]RUR24893.1 FAD-binding oxidoreductase [Legionella qingyii]RUR28833.1 FAD-binding oxidoreductase [Legionella qingyii]